MIRIKGNAYIYFALLLLLVPIPWLCAWLLSVAFHEFCHFLTVRLFGGRICRITIGIGGAEMESTALSKYQSVMALLAGSAGGLLLTLLGRWLPRTALCSGFLSLYNLLPFSFLDGGKILQTLFGERTGRMVESIILIMLSVGAIYLLIISQFGIFFAAIIAVLWMKKAKSSCKQGLFKVQYR